MRHTVVKFLLPAVMAGIMLCGFAPGALANIALDKVLIEFRPDQRPVENINVTNQSDKPLKVSVVTIEVTNSGQESETEAPTDKLVVAPKGFELKPGESRAVRVVLKNKPEDLESIYRIRFMPSEPSFEQNQQVGEKTVQVGVIVSMGVLVMVPPQNAKPDLQVTRKDDVLYFENRGNVTASLQREEFCLEEKKDDCVALDGKRVYAGMKWQMPVPEKLKGKPYTQTVLINGNYSKLSYPVQ